MAFRTHTHTPAWVSFTRVVRSALSVIAILSTVSVLSVAFTVGSLAIQHASPAGATTQYLSTELGGISCPSASECIAVGEDFESSSLNTVPAILATTSDGTNWINQMIPSGSLGHYSLLGVSCPSTLDCYAVGTYSPSNGSTSNGIVFATTNGGTTWTNQTVPSGTFALGGVSCPSTLECYAVGSYGINSPSNSIILATTNGGTTWTNQTVPSGVSVLGEVSCPSTLDCYAAGDYILNSTLYGIILATTNGGTTWTNQTVPSGVTFVSDMSCPSTLDCYAIHNNSASGDSILATTDGGTTWILKSLPQESSFVSAIACPTIASCIVGESSGSSTPGTILVSQNGGTNWSTASVPPDIGQMTGVSCPSTLNCYAVGYTNAYFGNSGPAWATIYSTINGGSIWGQEYGFVPTGGGVTTSEVAGGGNQLGGCGCGTNAPTQKSQGRPVNTATGDFYTSATDISVPGAGIPLTFTRTYSSTVAQEQVTANAPGPLGYGWSSNLTMSISNNTTTNIATVTNANGSQSTFIPTSSAPSTDTWCSGISTNYCPTAPRTLATLNLNSGGSWTLVSEVAGQITYTFSSSGALSEIQDAQGYALTSSTGTSGIGGCLSGSASCEIWTSSVSQGTLTLNYNSSTPAQITEIVASGGSDVSYCYYSTSCTSQTTGAAGDLYSAANPTGTSTYEYDTTQASSTYQHDMISMTGPGGATTTNAYNSSGQVTTQIEPNGATLSFSYSGDNQSATGGSTTVQTTVNGSSSSNVYNYESGVLVSEQVGDPNPSTAAQYIFNRYPSSLEASAVENLSGGTTAYQFGAAIGCSSTTPTYSCATQPTSSTDALGNVTLSAYTSGVSGVPNGLKYCSVLPTQVAIGVTCPSSAPTTYPTASTTGSNDPYLGATINYYDSSGNLLYTQDALGNTTEYAYSSTGLSIPAGLKYCTVDPAEFANGVSCPSSAPTTYPTASMTGKNDPYLGATINYYDSSGNLLYTQDALGNTTEYAYTSSSDSNVPIDLLYCSVSPAEFVAGVTCPAYGTALIGTSTKTYDQAGNVLTTTNPNGATTTNQYSNTNWPDKISSTTGPNGDTTTYTYNSAGQVTETTVNFGTYSATSITAYDSAGRAYCTESAYNVSLDTGGSYPYNCPTPAPTSPPTPGNDPYPRVSITIYNASGQVAYTLSPIGGVTENAYDGAGNIYCSVSPYAYAKGVTCPTTPPSSPPTQGSDPYLGATITTYNALDQAVQVTDPIGGITLTNYDANGNVIQTQVESTVVPQPPAKSPAPSVVTNYSYNADNQQVSTTVDPTGGTSSATSLEFYDPNGNVYCSVAPNQYALGAYSSTNTAGYQCPVWQSSWITTLPYPYSLYSTTPTSSQALNVTTTFYDANGHQLQSSNPDIETTVSTYDPNGREYCSMSAYDVSLDMWLSGGTARYPYFCPSSPPSTPPLSGTNSWPGATVTIYNAGGQTTSVTDPNGNTTLYGYDSTTGQNTSVTNPNGNLTAYCYYFETTGCASKAPAGGGAASMLYSTTTPATTVDPSGQVTTTTYYPGGMTDTSTNPAGTTTFTYNDNGQVATKDYSGTASGYSKPANVTNTYYQDGSLDTVTDGTGTTTYTYDDAGDMLTQTLSPASGSNLAGNEISYSYYSPGEVGSVVYPSYGSVVNPTATYAYDATGAMISVTDWSGNTVAFTHDQNGNQTAQNNDVSATNTSGTSNTAFTYDAANQMNQAVSTAAASFTISGCNYSTWTISNNFSSSTSTSPTGSRNQGGQVTQYGINTTASGTNGTSPCSSSLPSIQRNFSYGLDGELTYQGYVPQGSGVNNFSYDAAGNPTGTTSILPPLSFGGSPVMDSYTQTFNAAGQVQGTTPVSGSGGSTSTYSYDSIGDQVQSTLGTSTSSYAYNQLGQMTSFTSPPTSTSPSGITTNYLYNADGLEVSNTVGTGTPSQLTWGSLGGMSQLLAGPGEYYIYGPGSTPVEQYNITATSTSAAPTFLVYVQGSQFWLATNTAGAPSIWNYDAIGNLSNGTSQSVFGYAGLYADAASNSSGLVNMRARWYNPMTSEFTSVDPMLSSTNQPYQYAGGDPVNNSDPSGMSASGCAGTPVISGTWGQCIGIAGSGNWVQQIKSSYYTSDSGCSVAQILVNGVVILQAPEVCYTVATGQPTVLDGRHLSAEWGCSDQQINTGSCSGVLNSNGTSPFKAGDKVCEQYTGTGISGNPNFNGYSLGACETIGNPNQIPYSPARNQPPVPNPLPPLQGFSGGTNLSPMPAPPTPQFAPVGDFSYTNCASTIKFT